MSATVLAALITGAAGLIGVALAAYFARRRAHRREAAAYLKSIAETIRGMREKLAKSEIPYDDGHEFVGLLLLDDGKYYEGLLRPYLGAETHPQLEKLRDIHGRTLGPDNEFEKGGKVDPETLRKMLADMQRVEGDVRAQARRISPTESRAN
jgi:NAD(P)-dependent dehydrogenase (short-subunit alcohol dehydrogenase family)